MTKKQRIVNWLSGQERKAKNSFSNLFDEVTVEHPEWDYNTKWTEATKRSLKR